MEQLPLGVRWRDQSVFDSFYVGPNPLVIEQLRGLHQRQQAQPAALWIWGPEASGKSHLLQAVCAETGAAGGRAAYFPLRDAALLTPAALAGCEQLDVVCIDDLEFAAGDAEWERALFSLYLGLTEQQRHLVLAASSPPAALDWELPDLRSRLSAALILQLKPLSEDEHVSALRLRAGIRGLEVPDETAGFLLRRFPRDLRTLCALLDTLDLAALAAQRRLTVPFIRQVLERQPDFQARVTRR
ncbi:MAG TPA: DnaA regulatory inactivator Hda [Steroidobacteraceae bacterium]|nr:DnaA regulatory inactivator Hda [Steroidobacteraceae bacterium]